MAILTKTQLVEYCFRRLGAPILTINIADEQIDDCIDSTFENWWHFHPDGLQKMYLKHQVTGTQLTLVSAAGLVENDTLVGPHGTTAIIAKVEGNIVTIQNQINPSGDFRFTINDTVISQKMNTNHVITNLVLGDMDNKWIPTSDLIYGVTRVMPFGGGSGGSTSSSRSMFDLQYQMRLNNMAELTATSIAYYVEAMTHLSMLDSMLNGPNMFRFNRLTNKIYIEAAWGSEVHVGDWVISEVYMATDPAVNARAFGEPWIRKHLEANLKRQWGVNLKKYQGVQLLGGVTLDGQSLYDEGTQEMKDLEEEIVQNGAPCEFFCG